MMPDHNIEYVCGCGETTYGYEDIETGYLAPLTKTCKKCGKDIRKERFGIVQSPRGPEGDIKR